VALRTHLESAYLDGHDALARSEFALALVTLSSILDAVITYAIDRRGVAQSVPPESVGAWPFASRIATAERAGLVSGACARLPECARDYRALLDPHGDVRSEVSIPRATRRSRGRSFTSCCATSRRAVEPSM
jgi:hypothetical protein